MARKSHGSCYVMKCYVGEKSINLVVDPIMGIKLSFAILKAAENGKPFYITVFRGRPGKRGIYTIVSSAH